MGGLRIPVSEPATILRLKFEDEGSTLEISTVSERDHRGLIPLDFTMAGLGVVQLELEQVKLLKAFIDMCIGHG